jgi:hypothetical protein
MTLSDYLNNEFDPENPILFLDTPQGANIDLVDSDFELPSLWRGSVAYERDLDWNGFRLTTEYVVSIVNKGLYVEQLNLNQVGTSPDGRALYAGSPFFGNGFDNNYGDIYNLRNTDKGESHNFIIDVTRPWANNWFASFSYTWGQSDDVSSVTSSTAFSNFGNRAIFNQNEDVASTSNYETRHRFLVSAGYEFEWNERTSTRLVLVYEGRSGRPYSWVFQDDFNNDGVSENDLFYVPTGASDPLIGFAPGTTQGQIDDFFAFINSTTLAESAGGVTQRNSETSPYIHRFDLNITQTVMIKNGIELEIFANLINVGNMINDEWGHTSEVPFSYTRGVAEASVDGGKIVYDLGTPDGPQTQANRSRWQVRLGATLKF